MTVTLDLMKVLCPHTRHERLESFVEPLNAAFEEFEVNTPARQAMFLAQAAHETGGFNWSEELASGAEYEGRSDLGNVQPGWGRTYKGRGIFQLTGELNYEKAGTALFGDPDWFAANPALAAQPDNACRIAGWYWKSHGLNELADAGDFERITRRINGGLNGYNDRQRYLAVAEKVLKGGDEA